MSMRLHETHGRIEKPGKVLLHGIPLRFVQMKVGGGGKKAMNQEIPLIPFIDFLITLVVFLLIPARNPGDERPAAAPKRRAREDYPAIFRTPAFWILAFAMLLCNLPQTILQVQAKLLLLANGVSGAGLRTTVQPTASAGATLRVIIEHGKFHGVIAATTPIGALVTRMRASGRGEGMVSP